MDGTTVNNVWFSVSRQTSSLPQATNLGAKGNVDTTIGFILLELKTIKILLSKHAQENGSRLVFIVGLIEKLDIAFVKA